MPQISKIRIVNCNYNDGRRLIPDELYDLASAESGEALNSLFNLNNGGGKTVLVQLMMQPVNPKAMAGGRHIEDYFVRPGDHAYILIEWNKDNSKEKLLTGIAIAASQSVSDDNRRGNTIRYYTFKTEYGEEGSPYSIAALELSKNENGRFVPETFDYVRTKAKASKGVLEYYSSDDSVKWAELLENYGIYRSEWEAVIETLNKDEGGLNQYFDNAKTSDKLISKFFIPAIEQKMKSVHSKGTDSSLETMLINYARSISDKEAVIQERDTNRKLLEELREMAAMSEQLYEVHGQFMQSTANALGFKAALAKKIIQLGQEIQAIDTQIGEQEQQLWHIGYEEKSKQYYLAEEKLEKARQEYNRVQEAFEKSKEKVNALRHEEDLLQCARLYQELKVSEANAEALKEQIAERENNSEDAEQIGRLKYTTMVGARQAKTEVQNILREKETQREDALAQKTEIEKEKEQADHTRKQADRAYEYARAGLENCKNNTDRLVEKMNLPLIRQFDGCYPQEQLRESFKQKEKQKAEQERSIAKQESALEETEKKIEEIPKKENQTQILLMDTERGRAQAEAELNAYDALFAQMIKLCEKYSMEEAGVFDGRLLSAVNQEAAQTETKIAKEKRNLAGLGERLQAAEHGYVHVFSAIMEYITATGIHCQTGEEYLCGLLESGAVSSEKIHEILESYPELAYAVIFDDSRHMQELLGAGNADWFPAAVPLFTMEQMDAVLKGKQDHASFLAVYDQDYFEDRKGYVNRLQAEIADTETLVERHQNYLTEIRNDQKVSEQFSYTEDFREKKENQLAQLSGEMDALQRTLRELAQEKQTLTEQRKTQRQELDAEKERLGKTMRWLENYEELSGLIRAETEAYDKLQNAYKEKNSAKKQCRELEEKLTDAKERLEEITKAISDKQDRLSKISSILDKVEGAKECELVEGEWEILFYKYETLSKSLNETIETLKNDLQKEQQNRQEKENELTGYACEKSEYEKIAFSVERMQQIREARKEADRKQEKWQKQYTDCKSADSVAENDLKTATEALQEFDNVPLPKNEIGDDFKKRTADVKQKIKDLAREKKGLETQKSDVDKIYAGVDGFFEEETEFVSIADIVLQEPLKNQWDQIRKNCTESQKAYDNGKSELLQRIWKTRNDYQEIVLAEIVGKLDAIADMLDDSKRKGDRLFTVSESLDTMIESIEKMNRKMETDLKEIENDFNDIVNQCMNQGKRMYTDLCMIASSSRAHIFEGKPQTQMVRMNLPEEKELSEEASRLSIQSEITQGANELKELIRNQADFKVIQKRARTIVSSERLLHKYICRESIQVKVYKIDMNSGNSTYKRWEDTLTQNSGAEKFVIFFAVVLTLMNYTRSSAGMIDKNARSVLILDNPFGKITSAHLLKPMFDIAKHFKVQLICLSDINKSDVVNCFDNVIKLVIKEQKLSNHAIMTHEGNELIEHGYYKVMNGQLSLF